MHLCELQAPPSAMHVEATKIKWTLLVDFRQFFPCFEYLYENLQNRFLSGDLGSGFVGYRLKFSTRQELCSGHVVDG